MKEITQHRARKASSPRRNRRPRFEPLEGRLLLNAGDLDTSFGGTGQVLTTLSQSTWSQGLAIQPDLKTVVVGLEQVAGSNSYTDVTLTRRNVDGSLDTTIGSGGEVVIPTVSRVAGIYRGAGLAIQPDGKIVVATSTAVFDSGGNLTSNDILVLRCNSDGSLDSSFGQNGETDIRLPQGMAGASAVAILSSGQIVVAGTNAWETGSIGAVGPEYVVARLTASGALDSTFGPGGQGYNYATISAPNALPTYVNSLAVDAAGNLLVGGTSPSALGLGQVVRYTPNGLLDSSFGSQGVLNFSTIGPVFGIGFQPNGQIIVGSRKTGTHPTITRLNEDGSVDPSFASNGYFSDPQEGGVVTIAMQSDGKILAESDYTDSNGGGTLVERLLPGGTLDPSFGAGGQEEMPGSYDGMVAGIALGPDDKITGTLPVGTSPVPVSFLTYRVLNDAPVTGQLVVTAQPPASVSAGTQFGLTVDVDDRSGNLETSYNGTVAVALVNAGGASLAGTLTVAASQGVASFSDLSLTKSASGYTILVSGNTLGAATTSAFTVTPLAASQIVVTQQPPASVTAGAGFGVYAVIEDMYGNVITSANNTVSVSLASNPGGSTLGGPLSVAASNGVAVFSGLTLQKAASGYMLSVASSGLTGSTTSTLAVTPAAATQLVMITEPLASVALNSSFGLVLAIEDAYGNIVTSANNTVTVALANNPTGAKLGGTTSVKAKNGYVTFSGLSINKRGTGYTLKISSSGLSGATTSAIQVT